MTGFIIINKPTGPTSHDIVNKLRKITGIKKIGHAGTLDPLASGVLVCAIGREATREIDNHIKKDKEYIAEIFLGAGTDTYDAEGKVMRVYRKLPPQTCRSSTVKTLCDASQKCRSAFQQKIKDTLNTFIGPQKQIPPMYSAKKIKGKKLYELARKGKSIKRKLAEINIHNIELIKYNWPLLEIKVNCSSGTYIRSLAHDIGGKLKWGGYLKNLQRTKVGDFDIKNSIDIKKLTSDNWQDYLLFLK